MLYIYSQKTINTRKYIVYICLLLYVYTQCSFLLLLFSAAEVRDGINEHTQHNTADPQETAIAVGGEKRAGSIAGHAAL